MDNKKYLIIKTNRYTGNFDRELMAFVFGVDLNYDNYANIELKLFDLEMGDITRDKFNKYLDFVPGEYGDDVCAFADSHPTNKNYNCDSIFVVLKNKLPDSLLEVAQRRLQKYCKIFEKKEHENLKILDVSYYEKQITFTKVNAEEM